MGYRSDVSIAIYGPEDAMVPLLAAERLKGDSILSIDKGYVSHFSADIAVTATERKKFIGISASFEQVKWYESYPDVQAWTRLLGEAAMHDGICTEFVRVGEDTSDIEADYHGDLCQYYLCTYTRIESNIPETETTKSSEALHDNHPELDFQL